MALGRCVVGDDLLGSFERRPVDQGGMLAGIAHSAVIDLAETHPVLEKAFRGGGIGR